ncbi:MAG: hypothetical protein Q7S61_03510 [bacterium]|nr:hypothetical protein [bacterium]
MNKKIIVMLVLIAVLVVSGIVTYQYLNRYTNCGPGGCPDRTLRHTDKPDYKELSGYGTDSGGFECSKPIRMVSYTLNKKHEYVNFLPADPEEARVFCHMTYAIEYKGKITVLQKPEVLDLISKYKYKDVSIKALKFELIKSEGFVDRLLPQYKGREIGCIIILETPNEKMVFLEDENLETFEQMDYKLFDQQLDKVSLADKQLFLENLR